MCNHLFLTLNYNIKGKNLYQVAYIKFVQFTYKILPLVQFFHVNKEVFVVSQYSIQKPNNKEKNYETYVLHNQE